MCLEGHLDELQRRTVRYCPAVTGFVFQTQKGLIRRLIVFDVHVLIARLQDFFDRNFIERTRYYQIAIPLR